MNSTADIFRSVLSGYAAAVRAKDVEAFTALYDADVHVFDMWGDWSLRGLAAWRAMATNWFSSLGEETVQVTIDDVDAAGTDVFLVGHATLTFTALSKEGKRLRALNNRITAALRHTGGAWKIVHEHTSAPIDPASMKAILIRPSKTI